MAKGKKTGGRVTKDLTGQVFGHVTVTGRASNRGTRVMWYVDCDCGRKSEVDGYRLTHHLQDTCGRQHSYAVPEEKPVTPTGIRVAWNAHDGKWSFTAYVQKAPDDHRNTSNSIAVGTYDTVSAGLQAIKSYYALHHWHPKSWRNQVDENFREAPKELMVDGVRTYLFTDTVRADSTTGIRGVSAYRTKSGKLRYRAFLQVKGVQHAMQGFLTPEDAYQNGRKAMEAQWLPNKKGKASKNENDFR